MIATERLGKADMPYLLEHGLCLDAASRLLEHVESGGSSKKVNQAVAIMSWDNNISLPRRL
jgi:hypothetical protein